MEEVIVLAREIMNKIVTAATVKTNGRDLAVKLLSGMYSGLPVVDEGKVVGVVTEFDLLKAVKEGKDLQHIFAEDIMTKDPICVEEETSVKEIIKLMTEKNIIRVPVVRKGKLIGVISRCDILNSLIQPEFITFCGD
jgi:CBS domain-containing protein